MDSFACIGVHSWLKNHPSGLARREPTNEPFPVDLSAPLMILAIALCFLLAGTVKGITGM